MTFRLPRLPEAEPITEKDGRPTFKFQRWWQSFIKAIETQENAQDELLAAVVAAQAAADAAQSAADTAQAAADAAQDAVDAIEIPPSGTRTVTTNDTVTDADFTILVDATGGAVTLTLPLAATMTTSVLVKKIDASGNAVNIARTNPDSINGGAGPVSFSTQYEQRNASSDGINAWYVT